MYVLIFCSHPPFGFNGNRIYRDFPSEGDEGWFSDY